jgi:hypothetical protein
MNSVNTCRLRCYSPLSDVRVIPSQLCECWIMFLQNLFFFRFRKRVVYNLITLTEYFTWEELPTRHPDTGYATKAGFIPKIPVIVKYTMAFIIVFQGTHSTVRMVISHDMIYSKWYPFDATVTPFYELVNLSQVISNINVTF